MIAHTVGIYNPKAAKILSELHQKAEEEEKLVSDSVSDPDVTPEEVQADSEESAKMEPGQWQGPLLPLHAGLTEDNMNKLHTMYGKLMAVVPKTIPKTAMRNAKDTFDELMNLPEFQLEALTEEHKKLTLAHSARQKNLYRWRQSLPQEPKTSQKTGKPYMKRVYQYDERNHIVYPEKFEFDNGDICYPSEDMAMAKKFKKHLDHIGMFIGVVTMMLQGIEDEDGTERKDSWLYKTNKLHQTAKQLRKQVIEAEPLYYVGRDKQGRDKQSNGKRMKHLKDMAYGKYFLPAVAMQMAGQNVLRHSNKATTKENRTTRSRSLGRSSRADRPTNSTISTNSTKATLGNKIPSGKGDAKTGWMRNLGL